MELFRYDGSRGVQEVTCYGVACVFTSTPSHKRGKEYASHMMRLLHRITSGRISEYNLLHFPSRMGRSAPEVEEAGNGLFSILSNPTGDNIYKELAPGSGDRVDGRQDTPFRPPGGSLPVSREKLSTKVSVTVHIVTTITRREYNKDESDTVGFIIAKQRKIMLVTRRPCLPCLSSGDRGDPVMSDRS